MSNETTSAGLQEIHDLYQRRVATALAGFVHIDLTIPYQSDVAREIAAKISSELDLLTKA